MTAFNQNLSLMLHKLYLLAPRRPMTYDNQSHPYIQPTYGWNFSGCTKAEFDVISLVTFETPFRRLKIVLSIRFGSAIRPLDNLVIKEIFFAWITPLKIGMANKWNISIKVLQLMPKYQTGYVWIVENPSSILNNDRLYFISKLPLRPPCLPPSTPVYVIVQKKLQRHGVGQFNKSQTNRKGFLLPTWCKIAQSNWRCRRRGAEAVGGHKHHKGGKRHKKNIRKSFVLPCSNLYDLILQC